MIVDASAVLAVIIDEADAPLYAEAIAQADDPWILAVNWLEAAIRRGPGWRCVDHRSPSTAVTAAGRHVRSGGYVGQALLGARADATFGKGRHPARLDSVDCFAYALARPERSGQLLYKGGEFALTDIGPAVPGRLSCRAPARRPRRQVTAFFRAAAPLYRAWFPLETVRCAPRPGLRTRESYCAERRAMMADKLPLMPKATAVWLVDNTTLTFRQIADFVGMHELEVAGIADGEVAQGIKGFDPIANNQLTAEEIKRCEADPAARLKLKAARARPRAEAQGAALHARLEAPGPAGRHRLAGALSPGDGGQPDRQADRHHQADDPGDPQPHALEQLEHPAGRPGGAGALHADRAGRRRARRRREEGEEAGGRADLRGAHQPDARPEEPAPSRRVPRRSRCRAMSRASRASAWTTRAAATRTRTTRRPLDPDSIFNLPKTKKGEDED